MPNFKCGINPETNENFSYSGEEIINAINNCLDITDNNEQTMQGDLIIDESSELIVHKDSNIIINENFLQLKKELNKYTGKLYYYNNPDYSHLGYWGFKKHEFLIWDDYISSGTVTSVKFDVPSSASELFLNCLEIEPTKSSRLYSVFIKDNKDNIIFKVAELRGDTSFNIILNAGEQYTIVIEALDLALGATTVKYIYGEGECE